MERTLEERIKEIDAKLYIFDKEREKAIKWGEYIPPTAEEMDLLAARENLFTARNEAS